jgi:cell fate regulator YaaT (PSP1 superfamily)
MDGLNIVGVQFRRAGRIYDFLSGDIDLRVGDDVVVETERGPSLAKVAQVRFDQGGSGGKELKPILRIASKRDLEETRKLTPEHATSYARERVDRLKLKMSVLQSEVQFGGNKVIVYFSAAGRVDFRELVKELASGLKARVELKQVGARDEAKLVGGIGICGREFCCSSFLREFVPVSIKMAKNQNLALNPSKVSGGCGRLLCCLTYENDLYTELRKKLPPKGTRAHAVEEGVYGHVIKGDVLNQVVVLEAEDGRQVTVPLSKIEIVEKSAPRTEGDESEAEIWGEDIDMSLLASLEDEGGNRQRGERPKGGGAGGQGPGGPREGGRGPAPGNLDRAGRPERDRPRGGGGGRQGQQQQGGGGRQGQQSQGGGGKQGRDRGRRDRGGEGGRQQDQPRQTPEAQPPFDQRKPDGSGEGGGEPS